jgi:hypothetical protein
MALTTEETKKPRLNLIKIGIWYVIGAFIWAAALATLQTTVLHAIGMRVGVQGLSIDVALGTTWIGTFIVSIFIGLGYEFFLTVLAGLWLLAFEYLHSHSEGHTRKAVDEIFEGLVGLVLLGAIAYAIWHDTTLIAVGVAAGASSLTLSVAGILDWFCQFALGIWFSMIGVTLVVAAFAAILSFVAFFKRGARKGDRPGQSA